MTEKEKNEGEKKKDKEWGQGRRREEKTKMIKIMRTQAALAVQKMCGSKGKDQGGNTEGQTLMHQSLTLL